MNNTRDKVLKYPILKLHKKKVKVKVNYICMYAIFKQTISLVDYWIRYSTFNLTFYINLILFNLVQILFDCGQNNFILISVTLALMQHCKVTSNSRGTPTGLVGQN